MTLAEFASWLDGFLSALGTAPAEEQRQVIAAKLATVQFPIQNAEASCIGWSLLLGSSLSTGVRGGHE